MTKIFLPSCKVRKRFPSASKRLEEYLKMRENIETAGCCKVFCGKANPEDTAVVVCNNCAAIMEESSPVSSIEFIWEIIDQDPDFVFPDYRGERMTIQDCWRAYEKRKVQDAIRSLLRKMNIEVVELKEHHQNTKFCGADLLEACTETEKKFAPRRYGKEGADCYHPIPEEEEDIWLRNYCSQIQTEKTVCYCMSCLDGIKRGGKSAVHLMELLFPEG